MTDKMLYILISIPNSTSYVRCGFLINKGILYEFINPSARYQLCKMPMLWAWSRLSQNNHEKKSDASFNITKSKDVKVNQFVTDHYYSKNRQIKLVQITYLLSTIKI